MPVSVKYLSKKTGQPIDTLETELKSEGWLSPDESLLNILRDQPRVLRRGPLSQDFGAKPVSEYTDQEKKIASEMAFEPEAPPEGEYKTVDAQDLPVGETLTIIDGHGPTGWDTYKVIDKDPFGVTIKDGKTVELKPYDQLHVKVDGIKDKLGSDGLFNGHDVQVDKTTGTVSRYDLGFNLPKHTVTGGASEIGKLYDDVLSGDLKGEKRAVRFGVVTPDEALRLKEATGFDFDGFKHTVDSNSIEHSHAHHGDQITEDRRGQVAVTKDDFEKIPEIVTTYDSVEYAGKNKLGRDLVQYRKTYDGTTYYVEEVRNKRRELTSKTMWKARAASDASASTEASPSLRPEPFSRDLPQSEPNLHPDLGKVKTPTGNASAGDYGNTPVLMQMPEIVELAKLLNDGKYPRVRSKMGNARGRFIAASGRGRIDILAELFKNPDQAAKTIAHEIGHLVDWLPDQELKRGNILGRIASLKGYMKHQIEEAPGVGGIHITPADKARLMAEAKRMLQADAESVVDHEITTTLPVTPADVLSVFNALEPLPGITPEIHDYIKGLSTAEKKSIVKAAMRGLVSDDLKRFAETVSRAGIERREITQADIDAKFQELFKAELKKRRLMHLKMVTDELKDLTHQWRPFDATADAKFTKYRYSSKELYADAISALITNPGFLEQTAPTFYRAFFNYLDRKPEVKAVYDGIQGLIHQGPEAVSKHRLSNVDTMFKKGHAIDRANFEANTPKVKGLVDELMTGLIDKNHPALKVIRGFEKQKGSSMAGIARSVRYQLEELPYLSSEADVVMRRINDQILVPLRDAGLSVDHLGAYLFLKRVMGDRADIANPLGHTPETAVQDMGVFMSNLGEAKAAVIEKTAAGYRAIREEFIIPLMKQSGLFTPDLMKTVETTEDYARFSVLHYLEGKLGTGGTARIYHQIGTLSEIKNPFIATVFQDLSVIRAARTNIVKQGLVDVFKEAGLIEPANLQYSQDLKGRIPVESLNRTQDIFTVMRDGRAEHWYIGKDVAAMFEHSPVEASACANILRTITHPIREVLVAKNPKWMAKNVIRDFLTTMKNISELKLIDAPTLVKYYKKAWREVWAEVIRSERSPDIETMMREKMLVKGRQWSGWDDTMETELDRIAADFGLSVSEARASRGARDKLIWVWEHLDKGGKLSELVGKVATYKYLKDHTNKSTAEIGHMVRSRVGTPDMFRRGSWNTFTNNVFMFSNIGKEGLRSSYESFRENPSGYAWKTFWINVFPALLTGLIGKGILTRYFEKRDDAKDNADFIAALKNNQRVISGISEYDQSHYTIVPLGITKDGKSAYLRIPQDYDGQFFGGLTHKLLARKFLGADGLLNLAAEQTPYHFNPVITETANIYTYYVKDQNPVDDYRGRPVIPERQFKAGHPYTDKAMAKNAWNTLGGAALWTPSYDDLEVEENTWKKSMKIFGVNAFTQFYAESDQGIKERIDAQVKALEQEKARVGLIRTDGLIALMNGQTMTLDEIQAVMDGKPGATKNELKGFFARKCGNVYEAEYLRAKTQEQKQAVLRVMVEDNFTVNGGQ